MLASGAIRRCSAGIRIHCKTSSHHVIEFRISGKTWCHPFSLPPGFFVPAVFAKPVCDIALFPSERSIPQAQLRLLRNKMGMKLQGTTWAKAYEAQWKTEIKMTSSKWNRKKRPRSWGRFDELRVGFLSHS